MKRSGIAAAVALAMLTAAPVAQADETLNKVLGAVAQGVLAQQQAEQEQALWNAVAKKNTRAAYRQYLETYPNGPHARQARAKLGEDAGPVASDAAQGEANLQLGRSDRADVQRTLARLGYYQGSADGSFGAGTRRAIARWQSSIGATPSGFLTSNQFARLTRGVESQPGGQPAGDAGVEAAQRAELAAGLSRATRAQVQRDLTALGYDTRGSDGMFGQGTPAAIRAWQRDSGIAATGFLTARQVQTLRADAGPRADAPATGARGAALEEELLGLSRGERADLQRRLTGLGYSTNGTSGTFGAGTRRAIAAWQGDNGLSQTGYLSAEQVQTIRSQTRAGN